MKVTSLLLVASFPISLMARRESRDIKEHLAVYGYGKAKFDGPVTPLQGTSSFDSNEAKKNVDVSGDTTTKKLAASFLQADDAARATQLEEKSEHVFNSTASFDFLMIQTKLDVLSSASFHGEVSFLGETVHHGPANFISDVSTTKLNAQGIEVADALEVGGAVFAKRLYTQDLSATGFVTASTFISKGDVNVTGSIGAFEVKTDKISSKQIDVSNDLYCSTAYVAGALEVGSVSTRKLNVKKQLIVNDEDFIEVIKLLEHRIAALENQLGKIEAPAGSN